MPDKPSSKDGTVGALVVCAKSIRRTWDIAIMLEILGELYVAIVPSMALQCGRLYFNPRTDINCMHI